MNKEIEIVAPDTVSTALEILGDQLCFFEEEAAAGKVLREDQMEVANEMYDHILTALPDFCFDLPWKVSDGTDPSSVVVVPRDLLMNWRESALALAELLDLLHKAAQQGSAWFEGYAQTAAESARSQGESMAKFLGREAL